MHRFFIKKDIPDFGMFILESEGIARQLLHVLKMKKGEEIIFFNGGGFDYKTRIDKISSRYVSGKIVEKAENDKDPVRKVHLYPALIKKNKFEWVLEKGTELGVKYFHPVVSERSIRTGTNMDRTLRIVKEATEQSCQDRIPEVYDAVKFRDAIDAVPEEECRILFDPRGTLLVPGELRESRVHAFIGPEGGFTEREYGYAANKGFSVFSLGPRILRSETAAVVAAARFLTFGEG